jgi:hypothetical protein
VQTEGNMENTLENYGLGFTGWQKTQQTMKSQDVSTLDRNFRAFFKFFIGSDLSELAIIHNIVQPNLAISRISVFRCEVSPKYK